jgi:opacity protein-like surface antigen
VENKRGMSAVPRIGNPFMKILLIAAVLCAICLQPAAAADGYAGDKIVSVHSAACPPSVNKRRAPVATGGGRVTILSTGSGK